MGAIVIRTRFDEGTESAEVATSVYIGSNHSLSRVVVPATQHKSVE